MKEFQVGDDKYLCLEQYIQYKKARFFEDEETASKILQAKSIKAFQSLGSKIKGFNAEKWGKEKYSIMRSGICYKFAKDKDLKKKLARTGAYTLAFCGFQDKFWSCGCKETDPAIYHTSLWSGQNMYGKALMFARDFIFKYMETESCEKYLEEYRQAILDTKYYPQSFIINRIDYD